MSAIDPLDVTTPWALLDEARRVLLFHAHPDDESLATGGLIAELTSRGVEVTVVTATRGEEGEIVEGALEEGEDRSLDAVRAEEIRRALSALGVQRHLLLGEAPALAADGEPRRYRDSGMRWVRPGLAGPAESAGADSFTGRPGEEAAADLAAAITAISPDLVLSYDDAGTYGHPDHVHAHHVAAQACADTGTRFIEVGSLADDGTIATDAPGTVWREHPGTKEAVLAALDAYRTQVTVLGSTAGEPGMITVRHVGGQEQQIPLRTALRMPDGS